MWRGSEESGRLDDPGGVGEDGVVRGLPVDGEIEHLGLALPAQVHVAVGDQEFVAGVCASFTITPLWAQVSPRWPRVVATRPSGSTH